MRRLHQVGRGLVAVVAVRHAADERILVGLLGQLGEPLAEGDALHVGRQEILHRAVVIVTGIRLGVPGVVVGHATPQEDLDDRLGADDARRGRDEIRGLRGLTGVRAQHTAMVKQQSRETEQADAHDFAPGQRQAEGHAEEVGAQGPAVKTGMVHNCAVRLRCRWFSELNLRWAQFESGGAPPRSKTLARPPAPR